MLQYSYNMNNKKVLAEQRLVLNLGHSPLYRYFCKCLYIKMLFFYLFVSYFIYFLHSTILKLAFIVLTYRKSSKSSLRYTIQCLNSAAKILLSN